MMRATDFRAEAREALSGKWLAAVLTTLVASILGGSVTLSGGSVSGLSSSAGNYLQGGSDGGDSVSSLIEGTSATAFVYMLAGLLAISVIAILVGVIRFVIGAFVSLGLIQFNLDLIDGKPAEFSTLFSKTFILGKAVWLRFRVAIFTFLWALLLLIPGIIKSYSYSMAGFIMTENPEMTAKEAMEVSMKMMVGNKWRLFCLQLSFIGWDILSILTLGIGFLWVIPYENAAIAAFYDEVSREPSAGRNAYY